MDVSRPNQASQEGAQIILPNVPPPSGDQGPSFPLLFSSDLPRGDPVSVCPCSGNVASSPRGDAERSARRRGRAVTSAATLLAPAGTSRGQTLEERQRFL